MRFMLFAAVFLLIGAQGHCATVLDTSEDQTVRKFTLKLLPEHGPDQLTQKLKQFPRVYILDLSDNAKITPRDLRRALFQTQIPAYYVILNEKTSKQDVLVHLAYQICEVSSGSSLYIQGLTVSSTSIMLTDPKLVRELKITNHSQFSGECLGKFPNLKLLEAGDVIHHPRFGFGNLLLCPVLEEFHMSYLCGYKGEHETSRPDHSEVFYAHPTLKKVIVTFWYCNILPEITIWERKTPMLETASASSEASAAVAG